ncbi:MAG: hypothetical protein JO177_03780 [Candidatus Eremiobacteraeota bacterium]|nr:hypothetical protein [Candidatus Eremiobacteraeota bacterium]
MSEPFRFRLQALLDYRASVEMTLRAQAAARDRERAEVQARLVQLDLELQENDRAADLRGRALRQEYLARAIEAQQRIAHDREEALATASVRLREATKETKALERLRERRWKEHRDDEERAEEAELDESNARYEIH